MPALQQILFTAIPASVRLNPDACTVAVLVSPRLHGADVLGKFPDWLDWTARCQRQPLRITFACNGRTTVVQTPVTALQPELWQALFNEGTRVESYVFDDYSDRFVSSYPVGLGLGLLKATYQVAGIEFATPPIPGTAQTRGARNRELLRALVGGFGMRWDADTGKRRRAIWKDRQGHGIDPARYLYSQQGQRNLVADDGTYRTGVLQHGAADFADQQARLVETFSLFTHMPAGSPVTRDTLDAEKVLDFHKVLSSLNSYPALQRRLGLVFDLELPLDFLVPNAGDIDGELHIAMVDGGWSADTPTSIPATSTAYLHRVTGNERVLELAPRSSGSMRGLLILDPMRYGVAQVDVDGGLHKLSALGDGLTQAAGPSPAPHPDVFDPATALASLRSGGFSLFENARSSALVYGFQRAVSINEALEKNQPQPEPFHAEDLLRGFRIDVWDTVTQRWHSLHRRRTRYAVGERRIDVDIGEEEGFVQLAATQPAANADGSRDSDDLYLHEAMVRWSGWSLSVGTEGKHLTRAADPDLAVPDPAHPDPENQPVTPFRMTTEYQLVPGTLPRLRFGVGYRFRARAVDLAGNGLGLDDEVTARLTPAGVLPRSDAVAPYLRFEPIAAPTVVLRDAAAAGGAGGAGSSVDRLVIRTYNTNPSLDGTPAKTDANDRHIAPPRTSAELGERHGMFDNASGRLDDSAAMWKLIGERDAGKFAEVQLDGVLVDGKPQSAPIDPAAQVDPLPYLPDPLARAAAFRNLPGTPDRSIGRVEPGIGVAGPVPFVLVDMENPRPGSVTLVGFGGRDDWQRVRPFRLALAEGDGPPDWDPAEALLTVHLPKGRTHIVPLSACCDPADLKLLGVWQWLREYVEYLTTNAVDSTFHEAHAIKDQIVHLLQYAQEGAHGMLTPPHLLTLIHAVQQPLGRPAFLPLRAQFGSASHNQLRTEPEVAPTAETELDTVTAWRQPDGTDAWLVGALRVHGASTAKVDLVAEWEDWVDDGDQPRRQASSSHVDELPLPTLSSGYVSTPDGNRTLAWYDASHDLLCFAPWDTRLGSFPAGQVMPTDAVPCHRLGDTRHHVIRYSAISTSRYREYFAQDGLDFTRRSDPVIVDIPASARPTAPVVLYVVPAFGWQRDTRTDQQRSLRLGGGLRVYLARPWFSSGDGELLGVSLPVGPSVDRERFKGQVSLWGQDPIWEAAPLPDYPAIYHFPDATTSESGLPLAISEGTLTVDVAGHAVHFDDTRQLWYCDLTIDTGTTTYSPFVRLALVRYQPHALVGAKLSRAVLADFVQLTPERGATVTTSPAQPGVLRVAVSGPAPRGPFRNELLLTVQQRNPALQSDLAWEDCDDFKIDQDVTDGIHPLPPPDFLLWSGTLHYAGTPANLTVGRYRLLIREYEWLTGDGADDGNNATGGDGIQRRLVYAETFVLAGSLLDPAPVAATRTSVS